MAETIFSGPLVLHGNMLGVPGVSLPDNNPVAGPSVFFQGSGVPDVRYVPLNKDNIVPGAIPSLMNSFEMVSVDAIPQTLATNNIAAAQAVAGAGNLTFASTSTKAACAAVPVVPKGSTAAVSCFALDLGFQTVNINGTATVTITAGTAQRFPVGMWFWIGGTTGGAGTFTQVTANAGLSTTTTITVSPAPANTAAAAPVATTNLMSPYFGAANPAPTSVYPYTTAGGSSAAAFFDPTQALARAVQVVSSNAGDTTQTATIRGYDVYLNPMAEVLTFNGTNAVSGKKAFKYIASIAISAAMTGNASAGTLDIFGLSARSDLWEYLEVFMAGLGVTAASTGYTAADQATATGTTGDVRGTYAVQTASNGTRRLTVMQIMPVQNMLAATVANPAPLFGATQFTT